MISPNGPTRNTPSTTTTIATAITTQSRPRPTALAASAAGSLLSDSRVMTRRLPPPRDRQTAAAVDYAAPGAGMPTQDRGRRPAPPCRRHRTPVLDAASSLRVDIDRGVRDRERCVAARRRRVPRPSRPGTAAGAPTPSRDGRLRGRAGGDGGGAGHAGRAQRGPGRCCLHRSGVHDHRDRVAVALDVRLPGRPPLAGAGGPGRSRHPVPPPFTRRAAQHVHPRGAVQTLRLPRPLEYLRPAVRPGRDIPGRMRPVLRLEPRVYAVHGPCAGRRRLCGLVEAVEHS